MFVQFTSAWQRTMPNLRYCWAHGRGRAKRPQYRYGPAEPEPWSGISERIVRSPHCRSEPEEPRCGTRQTARASGQDKPPTGWTEPPRLCAPALTRRSHYHPKHVAIGRATTRGMTPRSRKRSAGPKMVFGSMRFGQTYQAVARLPRSRSRRSVRRSAWRVSSAGSRLLRGSVNCASGAAMTSVVNPR